MGHEYGINGNYFSEVREFYHFFRSALDEQGIRTADGLRINSTEGNPAQGKPATGLIELSSPNGKKLLDVNITLHRMSVDEMFADYHFNTALVRNVGNVNPAALERAIAAVHKEQERRSKRGA